MGSRRNAHTSSCRRVADISVSSIGSQTPIVCSWRLRLQTVFQTRKLSTKFIISRSSMSPSSPTGISTSSFSTVRTSRSLIYRTLSLLLSASYQRMTLTRQTRSKCSDQSGSRIQKSCTGTLFKLMATTHSADSTVSTYLRLSATLRDVYSQIGTILTLLLARTLTTTLNSASKLRHSTHLPV